jgi:16S rRNA (guanine966-N2)-methyltransferase
MRIIAGQFRSRQLLAPKTDATRPITDRVKQSLFDILTPELPDARVYDCFAGTGSMGLESLSRGAAHATFFEADRSAAALLRKNISALGVAKRSTVIDRDLFKWFETASEATERAGVVFLDPPYRMVREEPEKLTTLVDRIATRHLAVDGVIVFRHDARDALGFPTAAIADQRTYGAMTIELLRRR